MFTPVSMFSMTVLVSPPGCTLIQIHKTGAHIKKLAQKIKQYKTHDIPTMTYAKARRKKNAIHLIFYLLKNTEEDMKFLPAEKSRH